MRNVSSRHDTGLSRRFISLMMKDGALARADGILSAALESVHAKVKGRSSEEILKTAIHNVMPVIELRTRNLDGVAYQVPVHVPEKRGTRLAILAILNEARNQGRGPMSRRLAKSILKAYRGDLDPSDNRRLARLSVRSACNG